MGKANITLQDIIQAHKRIKPFIRHTPLEKSEDLSHFYNAGIYLKLESLQITGSFKSRSAFNNLLYLDEKGRKHGVIAPSAGNHGIGLAYAAQKLKVPAYIYLPTNTDAAKVQQLKNYGANIKFFDSIEEARISALHVAKEEGYVFLSAYNNQLAISAGGTVALEIVKDLAEVEVVITSLGGGGLTSGMCIALKSINPNIEVWGVQPQNSPTLAEWHKNGKVTDVHLKPSIAEGLSGAIDPETITFPIIQKHIDKILTVSESEIIDAMKQLLNYQYITEPSGAAGLAAIKKCRKEITGRKVAVVVTGRNISWSRLLSLV